jgi:hypothetical protein
MMIIRGSQQPAAGADVPEADPAPDSGADLLQAQAAEEFAEHIAAGTVPSIRVIRSTFHVGQPRAQLVRAHLAARIRQAA